MATTTATSTPKTPTVEHLDDPGSAVRFETQCVVIPDLHRSRLPRVVTKSYAFPLWKKRSSSAPSPPEDASPEENQSQLVLRVPLPTFSRKHHSASRSVDNTPLPPCLVHRAQPSISSCDTATSESLVRPIRSPRISSHSSSRSDIITVPLRPCCAACQSVTEAAVVSGDAWPEHFSRAASRRRSTSADAGPRTITVAGSAASASYGALGTAISVDEIDKRRRSSDMGPSTSNRELPLDDAKAKRECGVPLILCRSSADAPPSPSTPRIPEEEDNEDESNLFPLPSPKRTPTTSPVLSPGDSMSSFATTNSHVRHSSPTPSVCSGDSTCSQPSNRQFLAPPASSSSSLSLPRLSEPTADLTLSEDPPRVPSPSLLSALPALCSRRISRPRISCVPPTSTDMIPSATSSILPASHKSPLPPVPGSIAMQSSPDFSQRSTSFPHSPTHSRFAWRFKRTVSAEVVSPTPSSATLPSSPLTSRPLSTSPNLKKSPLMSSPRHVMQDVLRGVGSMGSGGMVSGM